MNHSHYQPHLIINPWEGGMLQPTIVFYLTTMVFILEKKCEIFP